MNGVPTVGLVPHFDIWDVLTWLFVGSIWFGALIAAVILALGYAFSYWRSKGLRASGTDVERGKFRPRIKAGHDVSGAL